MKYFDPNEGEGYATEAARASVNYAFDTLDWDRVIHVILKGNEASMQVARKLGSGFIEARQGLAGVTDDEVLIFGQDRL